VEGNEDGRLKITQELIRVSQLSGQSVSIFFLQVENHVQEELAGRLGAKLLQLLDHSRNVLLVRGQKLDWKNHLAHYRFSR